MPQRLAYPVRAHQNGRVLLSFPVGLDLDGLAERHFRPIGLIPPMAAHGPLDIPHLLHVARAEGVHGLATVDLDRTPKLEDVHERKATKALWTERRGHTRFLVAFTKRIWVAH